MAYNNVTLWSENHCVRLKIVAGLPQLGAGITTLMYEKWHWSPPEPGNCWGKNEAGDLPSAHFFCVSISLSEGHCLPWLGWNTLPEHPPTPPPSEREQIAKGGV